MKKVILIIILVVEILILIPSNNKEEVLKEIKVSDDNQNKNTLAIMLRGKDSENYTPSESNTWPGGDYKFVKAECMDKDGSELNYYSIIDFDDSTNTATITTKDTVYCYMYFAEGMNAVERIELYSGKNTPKNATTLEPEQDVKDRGDVLRRFQGTATDVTNNYICFGTGRTDECTQNPDKYMYRIIGYVTEDDSNTNTKKGQVKIIKKEALEKVMQWHSNFNEDVNWFESNLFKYINNEDENIREYLGNTIYVPSGWENKIAYHKWLIGDMLYTSNAASQIGENVFKIENGKATTEYEIFLGEEGKISKPEESLIYNVDNSGSQYNGKNIYYRRISDDYFTNGKNSKVGLMNASDYYLSAGADTNCRIQTPECQNGWINLSNNDSVAPSPKEWMMSRYGFTVDFGIYRAFLISDSNYSSYGALTSAYSVRPVIYLNNTIQLSGSGTAEDPFIITN